MKMKMIRLLALGILLIFPEISQAQDVKDHGGSQARAPQVDAEIWLIPNAYWAKLELTALSNIWDSSRNYLPKPNSYENSSISGSPASIDFLMNFDPLSGGCTVGGCFSYANYRIDILWKRYSNSNTENRTYYINYLDANINDDYNYTSDICGIDVVFLLEPASEDVILMQYKSGFPNCQTTSMAPGNGQSFKIWELTGQGYEGPNSARSFNIPITVTTDAVPNSVKYINGSAPPQNPCPYGGCNITVPSESTFSTEAFPSIGEYAFAEWYHPGGLSGNYVVSTLLDRSLYTTGSLPLSYTAHYHPGIIPKITKTGELQAQSEGEQIQRISSEDYTSYTSSSSYPNPFNPTTTISYHLVESSYVSLTIYDLLGRIVALLTDGWQSAGQHEVIWNAAGLPSGIYIYRLETEGRVLTGRMNLFK